MSDPAPPPSARDWHHVLGRLLPALVWPLLGVAALWLVAAVQWLTGISYVWLGVFPRTLTGLPGVVTAPLIHESWNHLLANTAPLLGLGVIAMYGYPRATRQAVPLIWILSGMGVWLLGRASFHIGISGLTHGLMFFVVMIGLLRRDAVSIALALIVALLFGGMASGVVPRETAVSFEYHLFGAIAGILSAVALHRLDLMVHKKGPKRAPMGDDGPPDGGTASTNPSIGTPNKDADRKREE
ncbi:MAG: rhomboid family intramembrane serine protease [Thioalkalivibrio sp.]|nr:rhomboid family intramembrane serine protease [Thioalkalivibrio sp.]